MAYIPLNLTKPAGISPGSAAPKNAIVIVDSEFLNFPPSDGNGVKLAGVPTLKPGGKFITIYSTKSKTEAGMESDGDEDSVNIKQTFKAHFPGNKLELKEFVQNWLGKNVVIFHKACGEDFWEVMGTPCAPLQLMPTKNDSNDGRFYELTFSPFAASVFVPKHYEGAIPFNDPFVVADAEAVTLSEANGIEYQLPTLASTDPVTFTAVTLEHGQMVVLIGGGGADPATLSNGAAGAATVALVNGTQWVGLAGAKIHMKVFTAGATTYLLEQSRG